MIASFALGFVIRYFLLMLYSSRPKSIDLWSNLTQQVEIFGARIPPLQVITIVVTIVILIALTAFLKRTRFGLEMRAAAENFTMARMLGVRANRVIMLAFAVSGMLAAAIGLILVTQTGTVDINMGANLMLVAFVATVIGGLGSLPVPCWRVISSRGHGHHAGLPAAGCQAFPRCLRLCGGDRHAHLAAQRLVLVQSCKAEGLGMATPIDPPAQLVHPGDPGADPRSPGALRTACRVQPLQPDDHRNLHPRGAGRPGFMCSSAIPASSASGRSASPASAPI